MAAKGRWMGKKLPPCVLHIDKKTATRQHTKQDSSASGRSCRKNSNSKQECDLKQQQCDNKPKQKQQQYNESKSAI
jgi:hypothetical protein